jgi:hypothetical protein
MMEWQILSRFRESLTVAAKAIKSLLLKCF